MCIEFVLNLGSFISQTSVNSHTKLMKSVYLKKYRSFHKTTSNHIHIQRNKQENNEYA